jgi:hypothetical protein
MEAKTWAGVLAKAAAMKAILNDECGGMEAQGENFYRSFAADVHRLAKEEVERERLAERHRQQIEAVEVWKRAVEGMQS